MSGFWVAAGALLVFSVAALLLPLLRRPAWVPTGREEALATYRARLAELEEDRQRGVLDEAACAQARTELEVALAQDLAERDAAGRRDPSSRRAWLAAGLSLVLVPAIAVGIYLRTGAHEQASAVEAENKALAEQRAGMESLIQRLEDRLEARPGEAEGWWLLGRSRLQMGEPARAAEALGRAWVLSGEEPELALDYAEALAGSQGNRLAGAPARLIARALELAPQDRRALWLSAMEAEEREAPEEARGRLETLLAQLEPDGEDAALVRAQMERLGAGQSAVAGSAGAPPAEAGPGQPSGAGAGGTVEAAPAAGPGGSSVAGAPPGTKPGIRVQVELDASLAGVAAPEATVFVFARALEGPPMPLAVARLQVKDLPATVVLDDSLAMMPELALSRFEQVTVGARVSVSGQATPGSGDLQGFAEAPVSVASPAAEAVRVVMRERLP